MIQKLVPSTNNDTTKMIVVTDKDGKELTNYPKERLIKIGVFNKDLGKEILTTTGKKIPKIKE